MGSSLLSSNLLSHIAEIEYPMLIILGFVSHYHLHMILFVYAIVYSIVCHQ
jgi:hypothetical protein